MMEVQLFGATVDSGTLKVDFRDGKVDFPAPMVDIRA